jgi:hypothetical protein
MTMKTFGPEYTFLGSLAVKIKVPFAMKREN